VFWKIYFMYKVSNFEEMQQQKRQRQFPVRKLCV